MEKALLVVQTDWTYAEGAIAAMKGVMKSVDRMLEIIDATHEIPQYDAYSASYRLYQYLSFWPKGTVFVSVVDPGVGTARRGCVALTENGYYIVTPDNGTLTHVAAAFGLKEVRQIDETVNRLKRSDNEDVAIFHGRDVFGYCAARLASGIIDYSQVGPGYPLDEVVRFELPEPYTTAKEIHGVAEINDPNFGNLWTNIPKTMFEDFGFETGDCVETTLLEEDRVILQKTLHYYHAFGDEEEGQIMIYNNELNKMALAQVCGNLCRQYNLRFGPSIKVIFKKV